MPAKSSAKPPSDNTILSSVKFTLGDWKVLRKTLANGTATGEDWDKAFQVLRERWQKRYLDPIDWIHHWNGPSKSEGEGFAIMTIACCLFESVAAAYLGKVYHYDQKVRDKAGTWAYRHSECCYLRVLQKHPAFKDTWLSTKAAHSQRFYRGIRCGLIHEARTKAEFKISPDSKRKDVAWTEGEAIKFNRHAFIERLHRIIDQMKTDVWDDKKNFEDQSCRLSMARHMDWTFGLFDVDPIKTLKAESSKPWWKLPPK